MHTTLRKIRRRLGKPDLYFGVREAAKRVAPASNTKPGTVVAVTSSREGEGKTFVALTLAVQAIEAGNERVLLIDGDAKGRQSATKILGSGALFPDRDAPLGIPTYISNLDLLSLEADAESGSGGAAAALAALTQQAGADYDLTILDLPSLSEGGRMFGLLRCADGVVFVVQHRRFSVTQIRSYASHFPNIGVDVFGTVLNKRQYPIPRILYNWL